MKNKKLWITIGIIAIIVTLFSFNLIKASGNNIEVEVASVKEEKLSENVISQGTLKLANEQSIYYDATKGKVADISVKVGDDVQAGTPLFTYKSDQLLMEQKQNELQIQSVNLQIEDTQKQLKEIDKLLKDNKDDETLKKERDQVNLQLEQAKLELKQAQLQKDNINQQLADLKVVSDIAGKIIEINEDAQFKTNSEIPEPIMKIGSIGQFIVVGKVSEYDALKISEGQAVKLTADTVPDKTWSGKVKSISYLPEESTGLQDSGAQSGVQYTIEIEVTDQNIELKPGFQMIIEITANEYTAKTLPLTAVKQDGEKSYVFIVKDGKAVRKEVKVGNASLESIEIKDGVTKKDKVIKDPSGDIQDGMEVIVK